MQQMYRRAAKDVNDHVVVLIILVEIPYRAIMLALCYVTMGSDVGFQNP